MDIDLRPPLDAGGFRIGSTRDEALAQCNALGDHSQFRRGSESTPSIQVDRPSGLTAFVYFDDRDLVEAVEFGRPHISEDAVWFRGIDVFGSLAEDLLERLSEFGQVKVEDGGRSVTVPSLLLGIWRPVVPEAPDDPEGLYFESVLVAKPGYDG